jgi:hypothetical protein
MHTVTHAHMHAHSHMCMHAHTLILATHRWLCIWNLVPETLCHLDSILEVPMTKASSLGLWAVGWKVADA